MNIAPSPSVRRMHQLAWQPGAWLHKSWWAHLDLDGWEVPYARHASCRSSIDTVLVARRGFPDAALPATLSHAQEALLALEPELLKLTTALGLIALDCPEYLLLRDYRKALSEQLQDRACEQLFVLHHVWKSQPAMVGPSALGEVALQAGTQWLTREAGNCPATHGLLGLLPCMPSDCDNHNPSHTTGARDWLIKLGRFL